LPEPGGHPPHDSHADPNYAAAYAELSREIFLDVWLGASKSPQESLMKAIELDKSMASAYGLLGQYFTMLRQHEKGIAETQSVGSSKFYILCQPPTNPTQKPRK
jgi:hypothetical protein